MRWWMAKRDLQELLFREQPPEAPHAAFLPPFPSTKAIMTSLSGVRSDSVALGETNFLSWIDIALEYPDEIREIEYGFEQRASYYFYYLETEGKAPAFVVELAWADDAARVSDFSLVVDDTELLKLRLAKLTYSRAGEWERDQLVRSLSDQALKKYEEDCLDEARQLIDSAIRIGGPRYADLYNNRGLISWKMGQTEQAKSDFLESIGLEEGNGDPYFNMGLILFDETNLDEALRYLRRAVELNPSDTQFLTELGHLYLEMEREDEALKLFSQAVKRDPEDPQVDFHLGHYFLYKKGKPRSAVKYYGQGLKKDPEDQFALADLAMAHWVLGNRRKTLEIQHLLQKKPRLMPYTISRLVHLSVQMGKYENALKYYHEALSQGEPYEPEWLHYNAALVYAKTGRAQQALDSLDLAVKVGGEAVIQRAMSDKTLSGLKTLPDFKRLIKLNAKRKNR
jgi:tetratricopeptide (TPR) repeat protein